MSSYGAWALGQTMHSLVTRPVLSAHDGRQSHIKISHRPSSLTFSRTQRTGRPPLSAGVVIIFIASSFLQGIHTGLLGSLRPPSIISTPLGFFSRGSPSLYFRGPSQRGLR